MVYISGETLTEYVADGCREYYKSNGRLGARMKWKIISEATRFMRHNEKESLTLQELKRILNTAGGVNKSDKTTAVKFKFEPSYKDDKNVAFLSKNKDSTLFCKIYIDRQTGRTLCSYISRSMCESYNKPIHDREKLNDWLYKNNGIEQIKG